MLARRQACEQMMGQRESYLGQMPADVVRYCVMPYLRRWRGPIYRGSGERRSIQSLRSSRLDSQPQIYHWFSMILGGLGVLSTEVALVQWVRPQVMNLFPRAYLLELTLLPITFSLLIYQWNFSQARLASPGFLPRKLFCLTEEDQVLLLDPTPEEIVPSFLTFDDGVDRYILDPDQKVIQIGQRRIPLLGAEGLVPSFFHGLAVDSHGYILVLYLNDQLLIFSPLGQLLETIRVASVVDGVEINSLGQILTFNSYTHEVRLIE